MFIQNSSRFKVKLLETNTILSLTSIYTPALIFSDCVTHCKLVNRLRKVWVVIPSQWNKTQLTFQHFCLHYKSQKHRTSVLRIESLQLNIVLHSFHPTIKVQKSDSMSTSSSINMAPCRAVYRVPVKTHPFMGAHSSAEYTSTSWPWVTSWLSHSNTNCQLSF